MMGVQRSLFFVSIAILSFFVGVLTAHRGSFPYQHISSAVQTVEALVETTMDSLKTPMGEYIGPTKTDAADVSAQRWTIFDTTAKRLPVIAGGGLNHYLHHCPKHGCLAVAFDADGKISKTWPYRPIDIYDADKTAGAYPHEAISFDPIRNVRPIGVAVLSDRDILVNFQSKGPVFPFGMGVARVGTDGAPVWTRFDYSHHWSAVRGENRIFVPALKIGSANVRFRQGGGPSPRNITLTCRTGRPHLDTIQVINGSGDMLEEIELMPIFLKSNWVGVLSETTDPCDPIHLNFVDAVGADAGPGLATGDLIISLRNISRFAILDGKSRNIKRLVGGNFIQQHSVQHLSGPKVLLFDNHGGDAGLAASRIVQYDLATGAETRIFPNADTPKEFSEVFSDRAGHLSISPDRTRVLASFSYAGRAFEIDIRTGKLLAVFDNVHDLSSMTGVRLPDKAARFKIFSMSYLNN